MLTAEQPPVTRWPRARAPVVGRVAWWWFLASGLAHGLFMYLAFPPASVWPLVFLALGPLVWAGCKGAATPVRAGFWTALGVLPFWLVEHAWLVNVTGPGYPALCLYLSLYMFLFVWAIATARAADWPIPMSVVVPMVWTALEVLRGSLVLTGYSFYMLAHPVIDNAALAAPAAVLGAYAVSFLCASLAGAVADATGWSGLPRHAGGIAALATVLLWTALTYVGEWSGRPGPTTDMRIAVVQTNVPQDNKLAWTIGRRLRDFRRFVELTKQAAAQRPEPDVIVWPETMFPGFALNDAAVKAEREAGLIFRVNDPDFPQGAPVASTVFADELLKVQGDIGVPILVGAIAAEGVTIATRPDGSTVRESERRYNSALVVREGRVSEPRYDKVDLMPFGEVIPYIWRWPALQDRVVAFGAAGMGFDLAFGENVGPLEVPFGRTGRDEPAGMRPPSMRLATPICFEVTRSELCRRLVNGTGDRAHALVNLSNDGWFGESDAGRRTHLLTARWRCVELGVPMVRAVNTGISCAVDRRGRVVNEKIGGAPGDSLPARPGVRAEGVLMATVPIEAGGHATIYSRVGDWPVYGVSAIGGLGIAAMWRRRRVQSRLGV